MWTVDGAGAQVNEARPSTCPTPVTGYGVREVVASGVRRRTAHSAASVREAVPVLRSRFDTCTVTVRTEIPSERAICLFDMPVAEAGEHLRAPGRSAPARGPRRLGRQQRLGERRRGRPRPRAVRSARTRCRRSAPTPPAPGRPAAAVRRVHVRPAPPPPPPAVSGAQVLPHGARARPPAARGCARPAPAPPRRRRPAGHHQQGRQVRRGRELADQVEAGRVEGVQVLDDQHGRAGADQGPHHARRHPQQRTRGEPLGRRHVASARARPAPPAARAAGAGRGRPGRRPASRTVRGSGSGRCRTARRRGGRQAAYRRGHQRALAHARRPGQQRDPGRPCRCARRPRRRRARRSSPSRPRIGTGIIRPTLRTSS